MLLLFAGATAAQTPGFTSSICEVKGSSTRIALRDFDRDGRRDLLLVDVDWASRCGCARLHLPTPMTRACPWLPPATLADLDGDGRQELLMLADGRKVLSVKPDAQGQLAATTLVEEPQGFLPRGIRRVIFVRDVDGDGRADLVLPGNGRFLIRRNLGAEGFATAYIAVACRSDIGMSRATPRASMRASART